MKLLIGDNANCSVEGTGVALTEALAVPATGDTDGEWGTLVVPEVSMPAGTHSLKLCMLGGVGTSVDTITFTPVSNGQGRI